ncbi:antibiotic biosynthesis monooxygenase [Streptomyces sp. SBT349]|uniref:globin domain-containing protein n=1 Tax=Streptomyces sp. SBT349 TaxID=1580539 RepID=UPI000AF0D916|nr:antibiotic biosynthesis monooxygenase [Streptomyces sp. SBT349]
MIVEYIRYRIPDAARRGRFEDSYAVAARQLDLAPECLGYELTRGVEEPDRYILRIEWTSVPDHPPFLDAVRPYIGDIEEMKHYERTPVLSGPEAGHTTARPETLAEAIGGTEVLRRLSETFYEAVLADPLLAPVFADFTRAHVEHVAVWLAEVFGGPTRFTDELGGHQALLRSHLGLSITEEQRLRWMELMTVAVAKELPDDALVRRRVIEYFDWGTRIARDVSADPKGTDLGDPGPTPRWGWHGLA